MKILFKKNDQEASQDSSDKFIAIGPAYDGLSEHVQISEKEVFDTEREHVIAKGVKVFKEAFRKHGVRLVKKIPHIISKSQQSIDSWDSDFLTVLRATVIHEGYAPIVFLIVTNKDHLRSEGHMSDFVSAYAKQIMVARTEQGDETPITLSSISAALVRLANSKVSAMQQMDAAYCVIDNVGINVVEQLMHYIPNSTATFSLPVVIG